MREVDGPGNIRRGEVPDSHQVRESLPQSMIPAPDKGLGSDITDKYGGTPENVTRPTDVRDGMVSDGLPESYRSSLTEGGVLEGYVTLLKGLVDAKTATELEEKGGLPDYEDYVTEFVLGSLDETLQGEAREAVLDEHTAILLGDRVPIDKIHDAVKPVTDLDNPGPMEMLKAVRGSGLPDKLNKLFGLEEVKDKTSAVADSTAVNKGEVSARDVIPTGGRKTVVLHKGDATDPSAYQRLAEDPRLRAWAAQENLAKKIIAAKSGDIDDPRTVENARRTAAGELAEDSVFPTGGEGENDLFVPTVPPELPEIKTIVNNDPSPDHMPTMVPPAPPLRLDEGAKGLSEVKSTPDLPQATASSIAALAELPRARNNTTSEK